MLMILKYVFRIFKNANWRGSCILKHNADFELGFDRQKMTESELIYWIMSFLWVVSAIYIA